MGKKREVIAILRGILGILLINLVFLIICVACVPLSILFSYLWSAIGFAQFIYVIPIMIYLRYAERWGILQGVLMGAGLTALLNAGYYGSLLWRH
jgi:hypothetical protein